METRKKHINELTDEFKPFWEPLFNTRGIENPTFFAKLCYNSNDFPGGGPVVRMYAEQISRGQDVYVEMYDWNDLPYEGKRTLYRFKNKPNWREDTDSYVMVTKKTNGEALANPSFTFRLSAFEVVHSTDITALSSVPPTPPAGSAKPSEKEINALEEEMTTTEKDDNHYAQMTIRDIYAIVQNTPVSNKKWLNKIITENRNH